MAESLIGKRLKRSEDPHLLTGRALFVDDVDLPGMLHVAFVRSQHAHARILGIDSSKALEMAGVAAVFTAGDLGSLMQPTPLNVSPPPIEGLLFHQRTYYPMAQGKVRFAGEIVAMALAESRYQAEDAAQAVRVDYEPLEAVVDMEQALQPGTTRVHEDLESNLAAQVVQRKGDYEKACREADVVIRRRFRYDRGAPSAMENRGVVASWDRLARRLTIWDTTQAPIPLRNGLAGMLGLSENQIHLIAPFIGGGFGGKLLLFYPEEMLIPWASMRLERPVKWIEDRLENFTATIHERGQIHDAEIAVSNDGRILGVSDHFIHDSGAYDNYGLTVPINSQCTLLGTYDVPNYTSEFQVAFTNKTLVTPYRGAGRQHGVFVMERLLDLAAKELGISPVEMRRRNLLRSNAFPHDNQIIYQDFAPLVYDSGDYEPVLDKALELIGYEAFVTEEQPRLRAEGRKVGIGVVLYVEGTGIGPYEGARVQVLSSGKALVTTGVGTQGQGHFTSFAQLAGEALGLAVTDVEVVTGDTDQFHWGTGTFASRGAVVAGNAIYAAAMEVRSKALALGAATLGVMAEELELAEGVVRVKSDPAALHPPGRAGGEGEPNPGRGAARLGAWVGGYPLLWPGPRRDGGRRACHDRRAGPGDPGTSSAEVCSGARLRQGDQSADCGGAGAWWCSAGHRQRLLRAAGVRRPGPAGQRQFARLPAADCAGGAAHPQRPYRNTLAAQSAGHQGRRGGWSHPGGGAFRSSAGGCAGR